MEQTPIVSIVIPVYNAGRFLWDCVSSVMKQTFPSWEGILVNDGSTDRSPGLCEKIVGIDPRFRVIHKENGGVSSARNAGIEEARGRYLLFLDADDMFTPDYLEKMVGTMETYGTDLVICSYERFRGDWKQEYLFTKYSLVLMQERQEYLTVFTEARTNLFGVSVWAKLYRMDYIRKGNLRFDPEITYEEDCDFNVRYLAYVNTVAAIGKIMYRYRQSDDTLSRAYRKDTFRFLVHGFLQRCALLERNGMAEFRPNLETIFLLVVRATSRKILDAGLSVREEIQEYRTMISFPESQAAAHYRERPKSGLTRSIAFAVRRKSPRLLFVVMRIWKCADRMLDAVHFIKYKIKYRKKRA